MKNNEIKEGKIVRLFSFPKKSKNAFLMIKRIYPSTGEVYASNIKLGGTINKTFSREHLNKLMIYY
jgi:hypothetical protein